MNSWPNYNIGFRKLADSCPKNLWLVSLAKSKEINIFGGTWWHSRVIARLLDALNLQTRTSDVSISHSHRDKSHFQTVLYAYHSNTTQATGSWTDYCYMMFATADGYCAVKNYKQGWISFSKGRLREAPILNIVMGVEISIWLQGAAPSPSH